MTREPRVSCNSLAGFSPPGTRGFSMPFVFHSNRDCPLGWPYPGGYGYRPSTRPVRPDGSTDELRPADDLTNANRKVTPARAAGDLFCMLRRPSRGSTGDHVIPTAVAVDGARTTSRL